MLVNQEPCKPVVEPLEVVLPHHRRSPACRELASRVTLVVRAGDRRVERTLRAQPRGLAAETSSRPDFCAGGLPMECGFGRRDQWRTATLIRVATDNWSVTVYRH
jgi:hypothetical protein